MRLERVIIIPARTDSNRMHRKVLREANQKPLIQYVYEIAKKVPRAHVWIAAGDAELAQRCAKFGRSILVTNYVPTGTHRTALAVDCLSRTHNLESSFIISLQADEPCINHVDLTRLFEMAEAINIGISTITAPLDQKDESNPNVVKAVVSRGRCHWFLRDMVQGAVAHVGVYCFARSSLQHVTAVPVTLLSDVLKLEQLTWIENNFLIGRLHIDKAPLAINTEADWQAFKAMKESV